MDSPCDLARVFQAQKKREKQQQKRNGNLSSALLEYFSMFSPLSFFSFVALLHKEKQSFKKGNESVNPREQWTGDILLLKRKKNNNQNDYK